MIRINLLKKALKRRRGVSPRQWRLPVKPVVITAGCVLGAAAISAALRFIVPLLRPQPVKEYRVEEKLRPSTFTRTRVVEEIVRERDDAGDMLKMSGVLNVPYAQLSPAEKVNYELLFAKNLCDLLGRTVPPGIGFRSLTASEFSRIEGVTLTASRDLITDMLLAMRRENVEPLARPQSVIRTKGTGFEFSFVALAHFGLDLRAPFVDLELHQLATSDNLEYMIKKLSYVAGKYGVHVTARPLRLSEDVDGRFHKFRYSFKGAASYTDFVRFVYGLHEERVPCAFERLVLVAQTQDKLVIEARLLFTTVN